MISQNIQRHPLAEPFDYIPDSTPIYCILLIHGFTASPTEVKPLGKFLWYQSNKKARISSILLPGHGIAGNDGYKALDTITWVDWINAVKDKIEELVSRDYPLIISGLSMGGILTCYYLATQQNNVMMQNIIGGVLLSPAIVLKGFNLKLIGFLKYFIKYSYKDEKSAQFFIKHNLFSYLARPLTAIQELVKLIKETQPLLKNINHPIFGILGSKDEVLNIKKTEKMLNLIPNIKLQKIPEFSHIVTVEPAIGDYFHQIANWIDNLVFDWRLKK